MDVLTPEVPALRPTFFVRDCSKVAGNETEKCQAWKRAAALEPMVKQCSKCFKMLRTTEVAAQYNYTEAWRVREALNKPTRNASNRVRTEAAGEKTYGDG